MSDKNKGIIYYLAITFGLAWLIWGVPLLFGALALSSGFQIIQILGAFAPALAAAVVRGWITREGFADSGLNLRIKDNWRYYLVALLLPFGITAIVMMLAVLFQVGQPDFSLSLYFKATVPPDQQPPAPGFNIWIGLILQLMVNSLVTTPFLFGEEFGWRGYLQTRLFADSPIASAVITGFLWGIWYLPLNLAGYNYDGHPILGSVVFLVTAIFLSIIFGWLFVQTKGIWVPSLAHAAANSIGVSLLQVLFAGRADLLFVGYYGILSWVPLGATCAWIISTGRLQPNSPLKGERLIVSLTETMTQTGRKETPNETKE